MLTNRLLFAVIGLIVCSNAVGQEGACDPEGHIDIAPVVTDGRIATGFADWETDPQNPFVVIGTEVWGALYQEDVFDPFFTDDPGISALSGSGLPASSLLGFNILEDLLYWNGEGEISFGPVPNDEQLRIRLGGQNRFAGTNTGFVDGFFFSVVGSGGQMHVHLSFFLHGADGNAVPASIDGIEATPGIYLLTLELKNDDADVASSDPIYIVFNNGVEECLHCTALTWVGARLAEDRPVSDLDFDEDADLDDFAIWSSCFTGPATTWTDECCQAADLNRDGTVDLIDFALFQQNHASVDVVAPPPGFE